jgi:predicted house-cleaning noncanonical NTP pyrophosphatase (MazG superfamily)
MKKVVHNKLVRDEIPKILKEKGLDFKISKLKQKEFKEELLKKLVEESKEVESTKNREELISELADIQEVMFSIYEAFKIECSDVTKLSRKKKKERGGFDKKIFLKHVHVRE